MCEGPGSLVWSSGWRRRKRAGQGGPYFFLSPPPLTIKVAINREQSCQSLPVGVAGQHIKAAGPERQTRMHANIQLNTEQSGITSCPLPALPKPTHQKGGWDGFGSVTTTPGPGVPEREKRPAGFFFSFFGGTRWGGQQELSFITSEAALC